MRLLHLGWLSVLLFTLAGCSDDPCGDLCSCLNDFYEKNPGANENNSFCKPQCQALATDHDSCVDFVAGRTSAEHSEQAQMTCASESCHKIKGDEPVEE